MEPEKLANVHRELKLLEQSARENGACGASLVGLTDQLSAANTRLWIVEDEIRKCEHEGDFGPRFVALARSVYRENDTRAAIKRAINMLTSSALVEEKELCVNRLSPEWRNSVPSAHSDRTAAARPLAPPSPAELRSSIRIARRAPPRALQMSRRHAPRDEGEEQPRE